MDYETKNIYERVRLDSCVCGLCRHKDEDVELAGCTNCLDESSSPRFEWNQAKSKKCEKKVDYQKAYKDLETSCENLFDKVIDISQDYTNKPSAWLEIGEAIGRCGEIIRNLREAESVVEAEDDEESE